MGDLNGDGYADYILSDALRDVQTNDCGVENHGRLYVQYACPGDYNGDRVVDTFDLLDFQNDFFASRLGADIDRDCAFTTFDFLAIQNAIQAGCP